ncbi:PaaI family thioesterase [Streptomyces stelliscabiei]|uniref:PaaI family thioesterase n=2 Tax=Streptomyces stelliscabiei TaxID=146820 RepID=UPI002FF111A6
MRSTRRRAPDGSSSRRAVRLDELMGRACGAAGLHGMTVSLQVHYHRPVPVGTALRLFARATGTDGRKIFVHGSIDTEPDRSGPAAPAVTADGVFVSPAPDRLRPLFPHLGDTP